MGKIDAVLGARSGERLLVERAFQPGRFTPVVTSDVAASEDDATTGLRWHRIAVPPGELARLPLYRRVLGRLIPDPVQLLPPNLPEDTAAQTALQAAVQEEPLTAGADLAVRVVHGVAVLEGWVRTVAGNLVAERLARTTAGVWEAKNRLVSDEELAALARSRALADPQLAGAVAHIAAGLGRVTVHLSPGATAAAARAAHDLGKLPGCREVVVVAPGTATSETGDPAGTTNGKR